MQNNFLPFYKISIFFLISILGQPQNYMQNFICCRPQIQHFFAGVLQNERLLMPSPYKIFIFSLKFLMFLCQSIPFKFSRKDQSTHQSNEKILLLLIPPELLIIPVPLSLLSYGNYDDLLIYLFLIYLSLTTLGS